MLTSQLCSKTVIVADDDDTIRLLITTILRRQNFHVLEASDGLQALLWASEYSGSIDLLLTDVEMPRLDGNRLWQLLHRLRPETKVLFITGRLTAWHDGADPILPKPFGMSQLLSRVHDILVEHPANAPHQQSA